MSDRYENGWQFAAGIPSSRVFLIMFVACLVFTAYGSVTVGWLKLSTPRRTILMCSSIVFLILFVFSSIFESKISQFPDILSTRTHPTVANSLPSSNQLPRSSFPSNSTLSDSACHPLPPDFFDLDGLIDERVRQLMPPPRVPRLQQSTVVRIRFDSQQPNVPWTGFWVAATKVPPQISPTAIMVMVIAGDKAAFTGFCETGQQFSVNLNNRRIVGHLDNSNNFGASVSFRDEH